MTTRYEDTSILGIEQVSVSRNTHVERLCEALKGSWLEMIQGDISDEEGDDPQSKVVDEVKMTLGGGCHGGGGGTSEGFSPW